MENSYIKRATRRLGIERNVLKLIRGNGMSPEEAVQKGLASQITITGKDVDKVLRYSFVPYSLSSQLTSIPYDEKAIIIVSKDSMIFRRSLLSVKRVEKAASAAGAHQ